MSALAVMPVASEPVSCLSRRLADLLAQGEADGIQLPDAAREQATLLVEVLRRRILRTPDRDHRSLFDLDDRLIELMGFNPWTRTTTCLLPWRAISSLGRA